MTRVLATGDLHLGKGAGYADDRLGEQEQVWRSILNLAVAEGCDAVLVAGDIFEGPLPTPEHYEAFARPLRDFPDMPVVACLGNGRHDAALRATSAPAVIAAPNFTLHATPGVALVGDVSVCALPWAPVSRLVAAANGGDRDEIHLDAVEHLLSVARGLRAQAVGPAVLLLHWSISGAALPNGLPVDLAREPVLPVEELEALGFDAVVAAHIHKPQTWDLTSGWMPSYSDGHAPSPPLFYTGSPMPLDFSEAGYEHGVWLLDIAYDGGRSHDASRAETAVEEHQRDAGKHLGDAAVVPDGGRDLSGFAGSPNGRNAPFAQLRGVAARFVPLESRGFRTVDADLTWLPVDVDPTEWLAGIVLVGAVDEAVVKVRYTVTAGQRRRMDEAHVRRVLLEAGAHRLFLEPDVVREERARGAEISDRLDMDAAVDAWLTTHGCEPAFSVDVRELVAAWRPGDSA